MCPAEQLALATATAGDGRTSVAEADEALFASYREAHAKLLELSGVGPKVQLNAQLLSSLASPLACSLLDSPFAHLVLVHCYDEYVCCALQVADCVCLFGLRYACAVPLDTHMLQVLARDSSAPAMSRKAKAKSLSHSAYGELGSRLRQRWGAFAGWAQAVHKTCKL